VGSSDVKNTEVSPDSGAFAQALKPDARANVAVPFELLGKKRFPDGSEPESGAQDDENETVVGPRRYRGPSRPCNEEPRAMRGEKRGEVRDAGPLS
jgi:hypothetical protein